MLRLFLLTWLLSRSQHRLYNRLKMEKKEESNWTKSWSTPFCSTLQVGFRTTWDLDVSNAPRISLGKRWLYTLWDRINWSKEESRYLRSRSVSSLSPTIFWTPLFKTSTSKVLWRSWTKISYSTLPTKWSTSSTKEKRLCLTPSPPPSSKTLNSLLKLTLRMKQLGVML